MEPGSSFLPFTDKVSGVCLQNLRTILSVRISNLDLLSAHKNWFDDAVDDNNKRDDGHQTPLTQQHLDVANVQQTLLITRRCIPEGVLTCPSLEVNIFSFLRISTTLVEFYMTAKHIVLTGGIKER